MAHKKAGGVSKNGRDSNPKYLGVKLSGGQKAFSGSVIVRQRGTVIVPGKNVRVGRDHTLYSLSEGIIKFGLKRVKHFNNKIVNKKMVSVI